MRTLILFTFLHMGYTFAQTAPIEVKVLNFKNQPYSGDKVYFVAQDHSGSFSGVTDANGRFHIDLPAGKVYDIKILSIGDEVEYNTIEVPVLEEGQFFKEMELIISYEAARNFELNSLQFETGSAVLKKESYSLLKDLVEIMKLKPSMKIEIDGHTDSDGDAETNQKLSEQRADAVKNYLVTQGIQSNRMITRGFGETRPISDNSNPSGKARNRRTEIIIQ